jgi:tryptophan 2,3-dioxygenase
MQSENGIGKRLYEKYQELGENPSTHLEGLYHTKPITYWDYIEVETLLSLQRPRTGFEDEMIFILYHQVTELVMKMMLHEIKQVSGNATVDATLLEDKVNRLNRYTGLLINSFDIMREGMNYDDYVQFRKTLTPASGFQCAQFRFLELHSTRLENLLRKESKKLLSGNPSVEELFEYIYWKSAGTDKETGEKTYTLRQFEEKYQEQFISLAENIKGHTLEDKVLSMGSHLPASLKQVLRQFDYLYNVQWPLVHLNTAKHYLDARGEEKAATGGSQWKKYLHPKYQQRKFFPHLWSADELANWGEETIHKTTA